MPKLCPKCGKVYGDDDRFCYVDGGKLVEHPVSPPPTGTHAAPAKVDRDAYLGKTLLNQFEIFEVCGSGSMGTVYKAHQKEIERVVAIKVLHPQLAHQPEAVLRFHREAKVISNLNHPNIVHIYLFGHLSDGNLYIVQEYVDGRSLDAEMKHSFNVSRTIHIAGQILSAVGEAHAHGVIHRDLKPENIMLKAVGDDNDFVKILDFGVAKKIVTQTFATKEGLIFGSPKYISPEAAMGEKIDARSDLYSLGIILYQMISGELPFQGNTPIELLMEHINTAPTPLRSKRAASNVPIELEIIIMRLLAKNPRERYPTALATREALMAVQRTSPAGSAVPAAATRAASPGNERMLTAQASDSFAAAATKKDLPPLESPGEPGYTDYTTQEDIVGTQELYAQQIRKEKMKKALVLAAFVIAIPVLCAAAYFGYRLLKNAFFPYDKLASGQEEKGSTGQEQPPVDEKEEETKTQKETEDREVPIEETSSLQADIMIENQDVPLAGTPVKFACYLLNEKEAVQRPHFIIKSSDGVEIKLAADEMLTQEDGKRKFTSEYSFSAAGPYIVTFASIKKPYSPSVRIHIQEKSSGKKKKKSGKKDKPLIIKEILPDDALKGDLKKPPQFGPDVVIETIEPPEEKEPPKG
ncbi:MAG: serine/threonine-protein kinase, partial [Pseudomonadota bacterium]